MQMSEKDREVALLREKYQILKVSFLNSGGHSNLLFK